MKIVVDAMGGDHAPGVVVAGAVAEARERGTALILVGIEEQVRAELAKHGDTSGLPIEVVHASEVVAMDEHTMAVRAKRDSSLMVGMRLVKEGRADAFASAGNSGAVMAAALFALGRIPGVERPALGSIYPASPEPCLVIDIGGSWVKGVPTRSLYHFELMIALCTKVGFYLAEEFYWWNKAKLPSPAEWVTVRRIRVKDAVDPVWWLSKTPFPKADNRRVLAPYSDSMKTLLRDGYKAKKRPSGWDITDKFSKDHGGAIPPNILTFSHTESNSRYLQRCRDEGLAPHPARFPPALPEFFIKFLTDPGDLVLDPFAGSNVTGAVAESLGRRWLAYELVDDYLRGSTFRFDRVVMPEENAEAVSAAGGQTTGGQAPG